MAAPVDMEPIEELAPELSGEYQQQQQQQYYADPNAAYAAYGYSGYENYYGYGSGYSTGPYRSEASAANAEEQLSRSGAEAGQSQSTETPWWDESTASTAYMAPPPAGYHNDTAYSSQYSSGYGYGSGSYEGYDYNNSAYQSPAPIHGSSGITPAETSSDSASSNGRRGTPEKKSMSSKAQAQQQQLPAPRSNQRAKAKSPTPAPNVPLMPNGKPMTAKAMREQAMATGPATVAIPKPRSKVVEEQRTNELEEAAAAAAEMAEAVERDNRELVHQSTPKEEAQKPRAHPKKEDKWVEDTWHKVSPAPSTSNTATVTRTEKVTAAPAPKRAKAAEPVVVPQVSKPKLTAAAKSAEAGERKTQSRFALLAEESADESSEDDAEVAKTLAAPKKEAAAKKDRPAKQKEDEDALLAALKKATDHSEEAAKEAARSHRSCPSLVSAILPAEVVASSQRERSEVKALRVAFRRADGLKSLASRLNTLSDAVPLLNAAKRHAAASKGPAVPPRVAVELLLRLAEVNGEVNDYERSRYFANEALSLVRSHQDASWSRYAEMLAQLQICATLERQVNPSAGKPALVAALRIAMELGSAQMMGWCVSHMTVLLELLGRFDCQATWYAIGNRLARSCGDSRLQCRLAIGEATMLLTINELSAADECLDRAIRLAQTLREADATMLPSALQLKAQVALQRGDLATALSLHETELEAVADDKLALASALASVATVHRQLGNLQAASDAVAREVGVVQEFGVPQREMEALGNAGTLHRLMGHHTRAAMAHRRELELAREQQERPCVARALLNQGQVEVAQGDVAAAEATILEALATLEHIPEAERATYLTRISVCETEWRAYDALEELFLSVDRPLDAMRFADRKRLAAVLEGCRFGRRLRCNGEAGPRKAPATRDEFVSKRILSTATLKSLCSSTGADAIVAYSVAWEEMSRDHIVAIVLRGGEATAVKVPLHEDWLAVLLDQASPLLERLRGSVLDTPLVPQSYYTLCRQGASAVAATDVAGCLRILADRLVGPLMPHLPDGAASSVCFVTDGFLANVPFAALPLPHAAEGHLVERFACSTSPSLAHLVELREAATNAPKPAHHETLHLDTPDAAPSSSEKARCAVITPNNNSAMAIATQTAHARASFDSASTSDTVPAASALVASLVAELDVSLTADKAAATDAYKAILTAQLGATTQQAALTIVSSLAAISDSREDFCGTLATRCEATGSSAAEADVDAGSMPLVGLFDAVDIAQKWQLHSVHAFINLGINPYTFRIAHESSVPVHRALHLAGAQRVISLQWQPADPNARSRHLSRIMERIQGGQAADVALRDASLEAIAAGEPVDSWGAWMLSGLR